MNVSIWNGRILLCIALCALLMACGGNAAEPEAAPGAAPVTVTPLTSAAAVATVPTFTPTPRPGIAAAEQAVSVIATATVDLPTPTPQTILTPTATLPAATLSPAEQLAQGQALHRYGDYAAARSAFAALLNAANGDAVDPRTRLQARYALARTYLADAAYGEALATLDLLDQQLAATDADPNAFASKEQYLRAEAQLGQGNYSDAIAAYWRFLEAYPWMAEIVQARIAAAYQALGDSGGATAAYRRAADAATDTVARLRLLEDLATTYSSAGSYSEAVAVYDEILAVAQNAGYRAQIFYLAGQALASAGDLPAASERWLAATQAAPASTAAHSALIEIVNHNIGFDLYLRAYIDLQNDAYFPAISAYQAYLASVDTTDSRYGLALHGLGQAHLGAKDFVQAGATFDRVIAEFPACECFGQAWLDKAQAMLALDDSVGARRTYRTFAREYAADPLAAEALWRSGLQAMYDGNQIEAASDFLTLADAFPASERAASALYAVGLGAVQTGLYSQAVDIFLRMQRDYPQYKWDAVAYWLGRAYQARGESALGQGQWQTLVQTAPDIYYGILSSYALRNQPLTNGAMLTSMKTIAGPPTRLSGDDGSQAFAERWLNEWWQAPDPNLAALPVTIAEDRDLQVGRLLLDLDQRGDALILLGRVYERSQDDPRALYALSLEFERLGVYRLSIMAMARLLQFSPAHLVEDAPIFLQQRVYPRYFRALIDREASANGLNPLLYYSLIRQESLFEEGAYSSAAAQGLAQIIPDTGLWVANQLGHPEYTNDIIYRPYLNVRFGAYYLDWVRDFAEGNLVSALVGYNAGPGNIAIWRAISGADDALFVEILEANEPRIYVQTVLANLYHYTRLYG